MQRCVPRLVMHFELRLHRKNVGDCKFGLLVASPVKRCTSFVVDLVNIQILMLRKVIKADGLVSLCSDVKAVCSVDIRDVDVCSHFVDHKLNQLEVAVVRCEMEGGKFLVCVSVDPALHADIVEAAAVNIVVAVFKRMAVHCLEALRVVLEG